MLDVLYDLTLGIAEFPQAILLDSGQAPVELSDYDSYVDLLLPVFRRGQLVRPLESIHALRERSLKNVADFLDHSGEAAYPVAIEKNLYEKKQQLVAEARVRNKK